MRMIHIRPTRLLAAMALTFWTAAVTSIVLYTFGVKAAEDAEADAMLVVALLIAASCSTISCMVTMQAKPLETAYLLGFEKGYREGRRTDVPQVVNLRQPKPCPTGTEDRFRQRMDAPL